MGTGRVVDSRFVGAADDFFSDDRVGDIVFLEERGEVGLHGGVLTNVDRG